VPATDPVAVIPPEFPLINETEKPTGVDIPKKGSFTVENPSLSPEEGEELPAGEGEDEDEPEDEEVPPIEEETPPPAEDEPTPAPAEDKNDDGEERPIKEWNDILSYLFKINPLMASVLRGSRAFVRGEYLLIDCDNPQFREIMNASTHNRDTLRRAVLEILGVQYKIGPYHRENKAQNKTDPLLGLAQKLDLLNK
jgi:DNA polymerase-3 subunit gamma/tau